MISKHLEHDYRLARGAVFASKGCLVAPRDHTTQAHRERSAHVAKERQAEEQTDRTCNRPYWPLLTILPLRPIRIPRTLPPRDATASQNVPLAYTSRLPWSRERAYKRGSRERRWLRSDPRTRWHSKTDSREIRPSQCQSPSLTVATTRDSESATKTCRESQRQQDEVEYQYRVAWRSQCTRELTEELGPGVTWQWIEDPDLIMCMTN